MSIWEPVCTSFIEKDNVLDQEAEEWNYNLQEEKRNHVTKIDLKGSYFSC